MVNEELIAENKSLRIEKFIKVILIILICFIFLFIGFVSGYFYNEMMENSCAGSDENILGNPLNEIISSNTYDGEVNGTAVVEQGIIDFNEDYLNYILVSFGINKLHKSFLGYGNPIIEINLDGEIWNCEIDRNSLKTNKESINNEDIQIIVSKQEAVEALSSPDISQFMKNSVASGNTKIEMIADKTELLSKGYFDMYDAISGK